MAGLAGAFVSVGSVERFFPDMTAGRGWLAIVIVISGNWKPSRILIASLVFAFLDAFQLQVQAIGVQIPYQVLLALPYVLAIVVMILGSYLCSRINRKRFIRKKDPKFKLSITITQKRRMACRIIYCQR